MNPINNILLAVGTALGLLIVVVILWLSFANAHLKTQLAQAQANATACHMANDDFAAKVAQQNKAVDVLKMESEAREKRAQIASVAAEKSARAYFLQSDKLREVKMQGDACKAAENILNTYLKNTQ